MRRAGESIMGWTSNKPTEDQSEDVRQQKAQLLREIADATHEEWIGDPVRQAMDRALDREYAAWREYGDDADATRGIRSTVGYAMQLWAQRSRGDTDIRPLSADDSAMADRITGGILRDWKRPTRT